MSITTFRITLSVRRLDAREGAALTALATELWRGGGRVLALDLSSVEEIDSMGISALIALNRKRPVGALIVLCGLSEYARDVIEVTDLHRVFDVFDSAEAAEYALSA